MLSTLESTYGASSSTLPSSDDCQRHQLLIDYLSIREEKDFAVICIGSIVLVTPENSRGKIEFGGKYHRGTKLAYLYPLRIASPPL